MPERPKRRKNKNKRKNNKNNGTDVNKNNISENTGSVVESSTSFVEEINEDKFKEIDNDTSNLPSTSMLINACNTSEAIQVFENIDEGNDVVIDSDKVCCKRNQIITEDEGKALEQTREINKEISLTQVSDVSKKSCTANSEVHKESVEKDFEVKKDSITVTDSSLRFSDSSKNIESEVSHVDINCDQITKNEDEPLIADQNKLKNNDIVNLPEQIRKSENQDTIKIPAKKSEEPDRSQPYIVETPEQSTKMKCKLNNGKKSKSCDDDDSPTIVEITDEPNVSCDSDNALSIIDSSNMIITGDEGDIEWEKVDHFNLTQAEIMKGVLSSDTIPLNIVHCEQTKSLSPEDEQSLRNFLQTLNLSSNPSNLHSDDIKTEIEQIINREIKYRLRKKGMAEDNLFYRTGTSRSLAVIDEEGSGDSSKTSRRHSYLSDKKSDNEELEDEVFEKKQTKSIETNTSNSPKNTSNRRLIPQPCIRVDAKLKEPDMIEARGDWSVQTIEKMTGAELVYLTDSSSSTSSIYDVNDDIDKGEETDVSVRMITPTIEVTDTESLFSIFFFKNVFDNNTETDNSRILDNKKQISDNEELNDQSLNTNTKNNSHEIIVLNTDNITTNLFVKDVSDAINDKEIDHSSDHKCYEDNKNITMLAKSSKSPEDIDKYDLEIKVLKCELNDAINNLIKEVISDSENTPEIRGTFTRQDSSSSVDSSQCTAKYNPTHSSLNDVSNILQDGTDDNLNKESLLISADSSHVKDVLHCLNANSSNVEEEVNKFCNQPSKLKNICLEKITSFPFGQKILEELANVSERLQNMSAKASEENQSAKRKISSTKLEQGNSCQLKSKTTEYETILNRENPPPVLPRKSSLKLTQEEHQKIIPKSEIVYECLSPSQKMLMEKTNTLIQKEDFKSQPNLQSSRINSDIYDDKTWNKNNSTTSIAPMKSETGSRLLAFLRDKPLSNNYNLKSTDSKPSYYFSSKDKPSPSEAFSKRLLNEIDSTTHYEETKNEKKVPSINFKPIPPPKPKKISSYFYESDESSNLRDSSFRSMKSNKKIFHYSTGNLSKEIENDISSIQNMHRHCTNSRERFDLGPRRPSLPKDLCDQQMEYIRQKEKEVDAELRRLEQQNNTFYRSRGPKAPMVFEDEINDFSFKSNNRKYVTKDFASNRQSTKNVSECSKVSSLFSSSQEELLREKMYTEYVNQMAEREQRKQQKIIKVTQTPGNSGTYSRSMPVLDKFDLKVNNPIEQEFISKAKERWYKLGIRDPETEDERDNDKNVYKEPKVIQHKVKVIEAGEEKDVQRLPSHIQEFVKFTVSDKDRESSSPGESDAEQAPAHVVVFCAVVILVLTVGKFLLRLLRHK